MNYTTTQTLPSLQEAFSLLEIKFIGEKGCETIYEELYQSLPDYILGTFFKFCSCGNPENVMQIVGDFLKLYHEYEQLRPEDYHSPEYKTYELKRETWFNTNENLHLFLLYYLDSVEFMEHGSGVYGSWITDKGKAFLVVYKWYQAHFNISTGQRLNKKQINK